MSVWLTIPSARPVEEANAVLSLWRKQGYKIALWRDMLTPGVTPSPFIVSGLADFVMEDFVYPGYAKAVNALIAEVMRRDPHAEWFVIGGDDTEPDPNRSAELIGIDCKMHFYDATATPRDNGLIGGPDRLWTETFGVMQPTGDRFAEGSIDRICGSAWLGREFCRRAYGGNGPLWPEFTHMFEDEHLQCVAQKLGILWQRPDLTHFHRHFMRANDGPNSHAIKTETPPHLVKWNTSEHWAQSKAIFERLRAGGFAEAFDLLP